jgi:hypothetical protein
MEIKMDKFNKGQGNSGHSEKGCNVNHGKNPGQCDVQGKGQGKNPSQSKEQRKNPVQSKPAQGKEAGQFGQPSNFKGQPSNPKR